MKMADEKTSDVQRDPEVQPEPAVVKRTPGYNYETGEFVS